mmetsp:Transcript_24021/g.50705  ORF Transcript_24021/g.50705 Transcript_24021/m.50705 type:complete len:303 (+) Transcript_24021:557-1465(+)
MPCHARKDFVFARIALSCVYGWLVHSFVRWWRYRTSGRMMRTRRIAAVPFVVWNERTNKQTAEQTKRELGTDRVVVRYCLVGWPAGRPINSPQPTKPFCPKYRCDGICNAMHGCMRPSIRGVRYHRLASIVFVAADHAASLPSCSLHKDDDSFSGIVAVAVAAWDTTGTSGSFRLPMVVHRRPSIAPPLLPLPQVLAFVPTFGFVFVATGVIRVRVRVSVRVGVFGRPDTTSFVVPFQGEPIDRLPTTKTIATTIVIATMVVVVVALIFVWITIQSGIRIRIRICIIVVCVTPGRPTVAIRT